MGIKTGDSADSDEVMNGYGTQFLDFSQILFDSKYNGFHARLTNAAAPNLDKVFYSTFEAEDADINIGFEYDTTNDMYFLPDFTSGFTEYIIIEATSLSAPWDNNNVRTVEFAAGKWIVYCTVGTDEVRRAQIHRSLWYGTDGTDALMDDFTSVTAVKTSHATDVDKRATYAKFDIVTEAPDISSYVPFVVVSEIPEVFAVFDLLANDSTASLTSFCPNNPLGSSKTIVSPQTFYSNLEVFPPSSYQNL